MIKAKSIHTLGEKHEACTGCGACAAACSINCITMQADTEGFLHPQINIDVCTNCDLCRRVCPVNLESATVEEKLEELLQVFAAWHLNNNIRRESSSGGVFTALAENILSRGGAVVGAAFDEDLVVHHEIVEDTADLHRLRGSKYVQSQFSSAIYHQIRDLLRQRRLVLFTGTPCQVAGLQNFLLRPHDNLFCCDLVCHGTPSPLLWERYAQHNHELAGISFRDKTTGWKNFAIRHNLKNGKIRHYAMNSDSYFIAYLRNYSLRPACYSCHFTNIDRTGDLTIADFWGVTQKYPQYDKDDKGTSLLLVNSKKGQKLLDACALELFLGMADLETAIIGNPMLVRPSNRPQQREIFYRDLELLSFQALVRKYRLYPPSLIRRVAGAIKRRIPGFQ